VPAEHITLAQAGELFVERNIANLAVSDDDHGEASSWKLARPSLIIGMLQRGWAQALPFVVTMSGALIFDLLIGVLCGLAASLLLMLYAHLRQGISLTVLQGHYLLTFRKDVSFLMRPLLVRSLERIPDGAVLVIDAERADFIDLDILETVNTFLVAATARQQTVELRHWPSHWHEALQAERVQA
jgi:MFS superfamily sulfate permease-like transporter